MKKYSIILYVFATMFLCGCNEEDTNLSELKVVKAELNFNAKAQEGFIIVSQNDCRVSVSETWCQATVEGDKIIIKVDDNTSLEGRTARVTISFANGTQTVPVSQMGGYFRLDSEHLQAVSDSINNIALTIATPFDYEVTASDSWITVQKESDHVIVNVEKNLTGLPRMATTTLTCPTLGKEIPFTLYQYSVDDLMGEWTAEYTNMYGEAKTVPVTLARHKETITVNGLPDDLTLKAKVKGEQHFAFNIGDALGIYMGEYRIYQCGIDTDGEMHDTHDPLNPESRKVNFDKQFSFNPDGTCACTFVADSAFDNGKNMNGLAITAYNMNGDIAGPVEMFVNFKLKR